MDLNKKKILVTGGAGFIGSNLVMEIQEKFPEAEITVLDNLSSGHPENLEGFRGDFIKADIATFDLDKYFSKIDVIFHEAAITDTVSTDREKIIFENTEGFRNVLKFSLSDNAILIYASSSAVYGKTSFPMRVGFFEDPLSTYGLSKFIADNIAREHFNSAKEKIIGLRYFLTYGPRELLKITETRGSFILKTFLKMKEGKRPVIFGDGTQKRDFVYVKDVVKATLLALEAKRSGIFNVGSGRAVSFNEVVAIFNNFLGTNLKPEYIENPYKDIYQYYTCADLVETKEFLGYMPEYNLEGGIRDYLK